jgi:hypothetical protein
VDGNHQTDAIRSLINLRRYEPILSVKSASEWPLASDPFVSPPPTGSSPPATRPLPNEYVICLF